MEVSEDEIPSIRVLKTFIDGKSVYDKDNLAK